MFLLFYLYVEFFGAPRRIAAANGHLNYTKLNTQIFLIFLQ